RVQVKTNGPAIVYGMIVPSNFLDVVRVDILSGYDDQVFFTPDHIDFSVQRESQISRPIPAILKRVRCQIGSIVVPAKQRITADKNFTDLTVLQIRSIRGNDADLIAS